MRVPIERLKAVLEHLLAEAHEQLTTLDQASTANLVHVRTLGADLWPAIDRLDRLAVLVIVCTTVRVWDVTWQRSLADQLDALHCRAKRLLARVFPDDELMARRFATRLSALDPLALFRTGPGWIADVAGKLLAGPRFSEPHHYHNRDIVSEMSLREADLSLASLSETRMIDLDAQGANLDDAIASYARLLRVNLARASMRGMELEGAVALHCDFTNADLVNARWHAGSAVDCSFAGADLMDMSADRTTFMFCDFQGADLVANLNANATMTGAQFVKCDLRWSRWHNRTLNAVRFIGCKLHGVKGANFDGASLERSDLSPAGDGSRADSPADQPLHEEAS